MWDIGLVPDRWDRSPASSLSFSSPLPPHSLAAVPCHALSSYLPTSLAALHLSWQDGDTAALPSSPFYTCPTSEYRDKQHYRRAPRCVSRVPRAVRILRCVWLRAFPIDRTAALTARCDAFALRTARMRVRRLLAARRRHV